MKNAIEINGVANLTMMIQEGVAQNTESLQTLDPALADQMLEQLDTLNRYMIAIQDHMDTGRVIYEDNHGVEIGKIHYDRPLPAWHDVRDNKDKFPTLQERRRG